MMPNGYNYNASTYVIEIFLSRNHPFYTLTLIAPIGMLTLLTPLGLILPGNITYSMLQL